ncbi:MAG: M48 family metalloprotease [Hydrogenophaga sp.]|uniref:M48 family metalloprotease n=1 Tax=Hydrogenophaga sp. TaxID=1904254 RepID=UPI002715F524|nr:M48 family metalloprotease [Hydrogenophaga sp.]MDO9146099.1 M48 family metalloprotease [Hydrogenophaga sp.]MDO9604939.1 M48 family metalloprotease [Hydrogenophaga sp.]
MNFPLTRSDWSARRPRWAASWFTAALVGALGLAPLSLTVAQNLPPPAGADPALVSGGLPGLGDVQGMSIAAERRLGDRIARSIYRDPDYLDDPVLGDYLQAIWQPLLAAARARGDVPPELSERLAWELMISRDRRVNAFALPGGYLGVHLGLIGVTDTVAELGSVMAHELSHVSQRHIARLVARQDRMAPWMMGAMILSALAARANTEVASAAMMGSQAVAAQTQLNFSRDMEREADRVGFGVLTSAGFDGQGFVDMFDKLQQASRLSDDGSFPYLRSHPLSSERMADMRARLPLASDPVRAPVGPLREAPAQPGAGLVLSLPAAGGTAPSASATRGRAAPVVPELHPLMAARARVLAENGPDRLRSWLQNGQGPQAGPGERYAAAWAAMRLGQPERALDLAQRLRAEVVPAVRWVVDALLLEVLLTAPPVTGTAAASRAESLTALRDQALAGGGRALTLLGAQAALATGEPQRAATHLQTWVVQHPRDALAWQTLARANQAQGQTLRAIRAEAESRVAQLDYAGAVDRFKAAQALPAAQRAADPMELAIVDSRLRVVEALLRASEEEE